VFLGGRAYDVGEGEVIYIPAGIMHAVESRDGAEVQLLWMAWGSGA
jgi:mannose-6-phosphate isomerase-like protein (cupin superfamily)